jgi:uncharacterized membrane-anchored protein
MTMILRSLATVACALAILCDASAQPQPPIDITTIRRLTKPAPTRGEYPKASVRVPEGLRLVTPDHVADFAERMKLAVAGDELGVILPDDVSWYTIIYDIKTDPLADITDKSSLNKDALMAWQEKFTTDHTPRKAGVGRSIKIVNWTQTPTYNAEKKILTMGVRMAYEGIDADIMNYKAFHYGPEGQILCLQTVVPIAGGTWDKIVGAGGKAIKLNDEVSFPIVYAEVEDETMYYVKLAGGGLLGAFLVIVIARAFTGQRRAPAPAPLRRPGLPR